MIWFTSDTHFGHTNILRYCKRPFDTIEAMNDTIVNNWNTQVQSGDDVYHLGDFAMTGKTDYKSLLDRLMGNIHLVRGNHDHLNKMPAYLKERFAWIKDYYELVVPDEEMDVDQPIILFHYPILSFNKMHHGSWHLHGHSHGTCKYPDNNARMDVSVDRNDYKLFSYQDVKDFMTFKAFKPLDHHGTGAPRG